MSITSTTDNFHPAKSYYQMVGILIMAHALLVPSQFLSTRWFENSSRPEITHCVGSLNSLELKVGEQS